MKKSTCRLLLSIVFAVPLLANANGFQPGLYEGLQLAVSPDNKVTGLFSQTIGVSTCEIYFSGVINKNKNATISAWSLDKHTSGTLEKTSDGVSLTIVNGRDYPGCGNVVGPSIDSGLRLSSNSELKKWLELVVINDDKVFLYASPSESSVHRAYVVKDDVVAISKYSAEWSFVTYTKPDYLTKKSSGWIKNSQYKKLEPPSTPEE